MVWLGAPFRTASTLAMPSSSPPSKRVLLIEDEAITAQSVEALLRSKGYTVESTDLGEDGLARALNNRYDIILLDLVLPGIQGFDVLQRLRTARVMTPVLILSGLVGEDEQLKGFGFGADVYVTKPFDKDELLNRVHELTVGGSGG